jgi:hypothetical protein
MIRIDEIYNNTFWPWLESNRPGTRMFFCDPPGHTDPEHLFNHGRDDVIETDFVFFHDQEPVDIELYNDLFNEVNCRGTGGLGWKEIDGDWHQLCSLLNKPGHVVVSERGENVKKMEEAFGWKSHYYFYHGWACLDWFRGYDRSFLIPRASQRTPSCTFMSPNRIVGGRRDHRVIFLYHIFKHSLDNNYISAPRVCNYENVDISKVSQKYCNTYPDIEQVLSQAHLPRTFQGELTQQMTSCWLSNFYEAQNSLIYVPTETIYFGKRIHLTEKTFKAIALEMPFVLVAPSGSLEYLREYGFKTFDGIIDESYDQETDDFARIEKISKLLQDLNNLSTQEKHSIHQACLPIVEHNYNHFYKGNFADILWKELTNMLEGLRV